MPNTTLLTTAEVADRLGVDVRTVHRWIDSDRIVAAQKLPGPTGAWLFAPSEVERFAADYSGQPAEAVQ